MSESLKPLDKKRGRPSNKNSIPVFVDGKGNPIVDNRSHAPENASYRLSKHVCTQCMGRLLVRTVTRGRRPKVDWRCSECGSSHVLYADEPSPCWCEKTAGTYGKLFECVPNTNRRPELPNEILVRERQHVMTAPERLYRPVFSESQDYL